MFDPSSFANPTPLAHADTSRDVLPRGGTSQPELAPSPSPQWATVKLSKADRACSDKKAVTPKCFGGPPVECDRLNAHPYYKLNTKKYPFWARTKYGKHQPSEKFIEVDDDNVCTASITADKNILEFVQCSKNITDADSDEENKMDNEAPNLASSKMRNIMKNGDRFNSCQVIYSQFGLAIQQNDHQARRRFVEWAQNEIAVVPDFHKRILFSDEAHFWLNGYVNKQNCRIWSEANPQVYVETPLHSEKLTVWCTLWAGGILLQKR
ncbi:DUF4817 domain-containing protein [Trichonephila clavipes]|nr:DUF4817 domain-containing protein [Trichonephila clavipes]